MDSPRRHPDTGTGPDEPPERGEGTDVVAGPDDPASDGPGEPFLTVAWESPGGTALPTGRRTKAFLAALAVYLAAVARDFFLLDRFDQFVGTTPVGFVGWDPTALDWLFVLAMVVFVFYVLVPMAADRELTARYWRSLRTNRLAVAGLAYLGVYFVAGTVGPFVLGAPTLDVQHPVQPPVWGSIDDGRVLDCAGRVVEGRCHGSLRYPLGTTRNGKGVLRYVLAGARVSLVLAMVAAMLMIPVATAVGTVAAYFGGWVDDLLMRYVDFQQTLPAIVVYLVLLFLFGPTLGLLVVVFGLLNWGGVARVVRSQALQVREATYVRAAESAGAGPFHVVRRHIVPNVSNAVVTTLSLQIPLLILAEAALSFLEYGDPQYRSWGQMIRWGLAPNPWFEAAWWIFAFPAVALMATVLSFNVVGDALRDALDPQMEG